MGGQCIFSRIMFFLKKVVLMNPSGIIRTTHGRKAYIIPTNRRLEFVEQKRYRCKEQDITFLEQWN